jgi:pyroglutamyl-peptidase
MKVLLTGFEPYWDYPVNSSWVVAEKVATRGVVGVDIVFEQVPVSFSRVHVALREAVEKHSPNMLIMLGQSSVTDRIKLERVALNMMDSAMGDNDGAKPDEELIYKGGESALFTSLPIKSLQRAIEEQGVAAKISNSCGLYVCNRTYYEALRLCKERTMQAIFVHLPLFDGQHQSDGSKKPTMPLADMAKAIQTIIETYK